MEKFILAFVGVFIKILICSVGVFLLWNGFMDVKFGLPTLSFTEAFLVCVPGNLISGS